MPTQRLSKRKLTRPEAADFSAQITRTPNIIGYLPSELERLSSVLVIEDQNQACGMLAYVEADKFIDLKILIVKEKCRGQGLGQKLFSNFAEKFSTAQKPIYSVTRNKIVVEMLEQAGFRQVSLLQLPLACTLHQLKMVFSWYRAKEYLRKSFEFRGQGKFKYFIKWPVKPGN